MAEDAPAVVVVGTPGSWSSETLADAVAARTGRRLLVDLGRATLDLAARKLSCDGVDLTSASAVIVKKVGGAYDPVMIDRLELLRYVAESGVPVFSSPLAMLRLVDRLSCTVTLQRARIPMPETVVTESVAEAAAAVNRFGMAVLKPLFSTKARGMQVIDARDCKSVEERVQAFQTAGNSFIYVQRMLPGVERDYGLVFLGGEYLASYARVRAGASWNTTIHSGGFYEAFEPKPEVIDLADRAQHLFGLDFTSVDVVVTPDGPLVFEVSAFGGFRGLKEGAGRDPASLYADYVLAKIGAK